MTTSVIVAGARTPVGKLMGSLKDFSGSDLGAVAIAGALEKAGVAGVGGRVRDHGPGADRRCRADARPAGGGRRRASAGTCPSLTINKMCLSGHRRHRAGRPADPRRRVRRRRRRRPGVDDQGAAPADGQPVGLQVRRRHGARPHGLRRPARRLHRPADGCADRAAQRRRQVHPGRAGRVRGAVASASRGGVEGRGLRRRGGAGEDPAAQGRPDRVHRGRGHPGQHHGRVAGRAEARASARTAPSPPVRRRRSPTAPARSW